MEGAAAVVGVAEIGMGTMYGELDVLWYARFMESEPRARRNCIGYCPPRMKEIRN